MVIVPQKIKPFLYRKLFGYSIGKNVKIGLSYIDSKDLLIADNVRIGHFNILKSIKKISIGKNSYIGNFNQLFGGENRDFPWKSELILGDKVLIMSHHFMDITGSICIGNQTTIAGRDSHFWSHSLVKTNDKNGGFKRVALNINIGENVYVGARATLVGCVIPNQSVVGAGSVVTKNFSQENNRVLIAGNPATVKKRYEEDNFDKVL
ncbi:MAG: DapH/DapD/GlmU-related protein [Cyanobacteria bacterium J06621_15]